jgi:hypothetical protein
MSAPWVLTEEETKMLLELILKSKNGGSSRVSQLLDELKVASNEKRIALKGKIRELYSGFSSH